MTKKEYSCEEACADIANYYGRALNDDDLEIQGALRALHTHVFRKEGRGLAVDCERCYHYFVSLRDNNKVVSL